MRVARISFSNAFLASGVHTDLMAQIFNMLPPDSKFIGIEPNNNLCTLNLLISNPIFKDVDRALRQPIPEIRVTFRQVSGLAFPVDRVDSVDCSQAFDSSAQPVLVPRVIPGMIDPLTLEPLTLEPRQCQHEIKQYIGLTGLNSYRYCDKCGEKNL